MASNLDFTLRRNNGTDIDTLYPTTRWTQVEEKPSTYTPTAHAHGNITNDGKIGTTANLVVVTGTGGALTAKAAGTTSQYLRGDGTWATPADTTTLASLGLTATAAELNYVDGVTSAIQTQLNGKAASSHTHGNITNAGAIGSTADLVAVTTTGGVLTTASRSGIDSRSTFPPASHTHDDRYYTESEITTLLSGKAASSHTHGNITNAGAIGSVASLPIITTTSGVLTTGSFGSSAGTFCQGNDSRLSDARTPLSHTHDDRYYTESEVNSLLSVKQNVLTNPVTGTGTVNQIAYWLSASTIGALSTGTYPSLDELKHVKGVTSAIQTQLNGKTVTTLNSVAKTTAAYVVSGSTLTITIT